MPAAEDPKFKQANVDETLRRLADNDLSDTVLPLSDRFWGMAEVKQVFGVLETNTSVKEVNLSGNCLGDHCIQFIAEKMIGNKNVRSLNLGRCSIGVQGARSIAKMLSRNVTLQSIDVSGNHIFDEGVIAIADILKSSDANMAALKHINVSDCDITDSGCRYLAESLQENQSVAEVLVDGNPLSFNAKKSLQQSLAVCSARKDLDISAGKCAVMPVDAVAHKLMNNASITELNLSGNTLDLKSANLLQTVFRKNFAIKKLNLSDNQIGPREATILFEGFKQNRTVAELYLASNVIGDDGGTALASLLEESTVALRKLDVSANNIGSAGGSAIANALSKNSNLQELDLSFNVMGSDAGCALARCMKENDVLERLSVSSNGIGHYAATSFADTLKSNKALQSLDLGFNCVLDSGATALSMALKRNRALKTLNLWRNGVGPAGATELFGVLADNETLEELQLSNAASEGSAGRFITGAPAAGVQVGAGAAALRLGIMPGMSPSYKRQNLSQIRWQNVVGDSAAETLAKALKVNKTLRSVDIRETSVHASAGAVLTEVAGLRKTLDLVFDVIPDAEDYSSVHAERAASARENLGVQDASDGSVGHGEFVRSGVRTMSAADGTLDNRLAVKGGDDTTLHNQVRPSKVPVK